MIHFNKFNTIKFHKLSVLIYLSISVLPVFSGSAVNISLFSLISVSLFLFFMSKKEIDIPKYNFIIWIVLVFLVFFISVSWSGDLDLSLGRMNRIAIILLFSVYIWFLISSKEEFNSFVKIFILSRIIMAIYIIFTVDLTSLGVTRLGADNLGEEWNANSIGMNLALASFGSFFILKTEINKSKFLKSIHYLLILLFASIIILTGSRKALFILVFSIFLFSFLIKEKYKIFKFTSISFILAGLIYLSFKSSFLYDVLGSRIDGLVSSLTGQGEADASSNTRNSMIEHGIQMFKEKPFLGHGLDNFRRLYFNVMQDFRYSHNNYIELLVGVGLVGTIIYYSGLLQVLKQTFSKRDLYSAFATTIIITVFIIDYGLVSYTSYLIQIFVCLSFVITKLNKKENI